MADVPLGFTDAIYIVPYLGPAGRIIRTGIWLLRAKKQVEAAEGQLNQLFEKTTKYVFENLDEIAKGNVEGPTGREKYWREMRDGDGPALVVVFPMWARDP